MIGLLSTHVDLATRSTYNVYNYMNTFYTPVGHYCVLFILLILPCYHVLDTC